MKKVYDYEQYFYIKGQTKDFHLTSFRYHLCLLSDEEVIEKESRFHFQNFNELWEFVASGKVRNAKAERNLFGARRVVFSDDRLNTYVVREKRFQSATVWHHCMECPGVSLQTLVDNLTADEMVEYFQERGIKWGNK